MEEKSIVFNISESHYKLFNECSLNIIKITEQIDDLYQWANKVKEIKEIGEDFLAKDDLNEFNFQISINSLILIASLDIAIITKQLALINDKATAIFYMKHIYLTVNEFFETYKGEEKSGKLSQVIVSNYPEYLNDFKAAKKQLSEFKKEFFYDVKIRNIRNKIAGHIDKDFTQWYETAINLDIDEVVKMIFNFNNVLMALQKVCALLMKAQTFKIESSKKEINNDLLGKLKKIEAANNLLPKEKRFDLSVLKEIIERE